MSTPGETSTTSETTSTAASAAPAPDPHVVDGGAGAGTSFDGVDFDSDLDAVVVGSDAVAPAPAKPAGTSVEAPIAAAGVQSGTQAPAASAPAPVAAPATPPAQAAPAPQATPPAQPTAASGSAQQAPAAPAAQSDPNVVTTPEGFLDAWNEGREALIERFAEDQFALTEEEATALTTAPETVLPLLLGRTLFTSIAAAQRLMMEQMPAMVQSLQRQHNARAEAETTFFSRFPHLQKAEYREKIGQVARLHKQMNPNATMDERMADVAALVTQHFKIQTPAIAAVAPQAQPTGAVVQRVMHQPAAAAGGAVRGSAQPVDTDPFAGAFADYDD